MHWKAKKEFFHGYRVGRKLPPVDTENTVASKIKDEMKMIKDHLLNPAQKHNLIQRQSI